MKRALSLLFVFFLIYHVNAQNTFPTPGPGNVGIGTTSPVVLFHIAVPSAKTSTVNNGSIYNIASFLSTNDVSNPFGLRTMIYGASLIANRFVTLQTTDYSWQDGGSISLQPAAGNVGVGSSTPISLFQVDDGCTKANIGDASGTGLNYGTSYLGFNAARSGTSWSTSNDGESGGAGKNGGGVIYSSIWGAMYFSILPTTGGTSGQALTDDQVRNNIAMRIDHTNGAL